MSSSFAHVMANRHESGLFPRRQEDTFRMIKDEALEGIGRKECGGGDEGGPWLELVKPIVKTQISDKWPPQPQAQPFHWFSLE